MIKSLLCEQKDPSSILRTQVRKLDTITWIYNLSAREAETGRCPGLLGQSVFLLDEFQASERPYVVVEMRNVPLRLRHLNTWSPVAGVVWDVRKCSLAGGSVPSGKGFESPQPCSPSSEVENKHIHLISMQVGFNL